MSRFFSLLLILFTLFKAPIVASADVSGLILCKDSAVYKRRLDGSVKKLNARLANYEPGTPAYLALEQQINQTKTRFAKYADQGLLCGTDGLPHLIADGRPSHAGEFVIPGIGFGLPILADIENISSAYVSRPSILDPPPVNTIPALIFEVYPLDPISF